jgi:DNA-binding CsgD family transcriptional regulator
VGSPELVGRESELASVARFVERGAGVLLLRGEAGIGKTALWREGVRESEAGGATVLVAQPAGPEARLAFAALGDLLADRAAEVADALPAPQRRALEVALLLREPGPRRPDPAAVARATLAGLRELAPVLVAVDDVQWLDPGSAAALAFAVRRAGDDSIRFLLTQRTERRGDALPLELDRVEPGPDVLELGALSLGALQQLVRARLDVSFPRPVLVRVHETSRGNPLLALELARALERRDLPVEAGEPLPVPPVYEELVRERVAELPAETREALLEVAALSHATLDVISVDALAPAFEAEMLERDGRRVRFSHPLFAAAVYAQAAPHRVRAVHARLAQRVRDPEERARHLALAAAGADASVADQLQAAGERALARGAPGSAAELFEQAAALTPEDRARSIARTLAAADAHTRAGDNRRGVALASDALEGATDPTSRAELLVWLADAAGTVDAAERAVAGVGDDPRLAAAAWNARSEAALVADDVPGALVAARRAADFARRGDDRATLVRALSHLGSMTIRSGDPSGVAAIEEAYALEDPKDPATILYGARANLGIAALWFDDLDRARLLLSERVDFAVEIGDEAGRSILLQRLIRAELWSGDLHGALARADDLVGLKESAAYDPPIAALWVRALAKAQLGRFGEARDDAELAQTLATGFGDPDHFHVVYVRGAIETHAGNDQAAVVHLERLPELLERTGTVEPGICPFHSDLLESLVRAGAGATADARIAEVEALGRKLDRPRLLVAAYRARAMLHSSVADAELSLAECARLPVPIERARTLLVLGTLQRRLKRWGDARTTLTEAAGEFDRLGASAWAERVRGELARVGGRAATGALTETERRVAELAANGRPNKEIAAELFLSVRGVEANLSRVYAKLGIRSRGELAQKLVA